MEHISLAGKYWARKHRFALRTLHQRTEFVGKYPVEEVLFGKFDTGSADDPGDHLVFKAGRWMLWHLQPGFTYYEIGTGHAYLDIFSQTIPHTICAKLYQSATPLSEIVALSGWSSSCITAGNPRIIRADPAANGEAVLLLLRVDWTQFRPAEQSPPGKRAGR